MKREQMTISNKYKINFGKIYLRHEHEAQRGALPDSKEAQPAVSGGLRDELEKLSAAQGASVAQLFAQPAA